MAVSIEAQGHTVDEAIQIALNQLGVSRDKVEIDILHHPRRGFLGIGARRAKVRATVRENILLDGEEFDMSGGESLDEKPRRRRRRGGRNRARGDERDTAAPQRPEGDRRGRDQQRVEGDRRSRGDEPRAEARRGDDPRPRGREDENRRGEGGRGRDDRRGRGGRGERRDGRGPEPRQDGRQEGRPLEGARPEQREVSGNSRAGEGREPRAESRDRDAAEGRETRPSEGRETRPSEGRERADRRGDDRGRQPREGQGERRDRQRPRIEETALQAARQIVGGDETSFEARNGSSEYTADETPLDAAALDVIRARAEELVRELLARMGFAAEVQSSIDEAAGEAVVSVRSESEGLLIGRRGQTLDSLEHIVNRMALRGDAYVEGRILLDIGDYRRRRRESLEELAGRLRTRAIGERRTVQVSPMSPRDRKFFAQAFAADEAVEVRSLGAGFYRRVVVAPAGMGASAVAESVDVAEDETMEHGAEADA